MIPNDAQRKVLAAYGLPVFGALVLQAILPMGLDVFVGFAGMGAAAVGGYRFALARSVA